MDISCPYRVAHATENRYKPWLIDKVHKNGLKAKSSFLFIPILYLPIAAKVRHIINNPTQNKNREKGIVCLCNLSSAFWGA
jgi:hypothetical protein